MKQLILILFSFGWLFSFGQEKLTTTHKATYAIDGGPELVIYMDEKAEIFYLDNLPIPLEPGMSVEKILMDIPSKKMIGIMNYRGLRMFVDLPASFFQNQLGLGLMLNGEEMKMHFDPVEEEQSDSCKLYKVYPTGEEDMPLMMCFDETKPIKMANLFDSIISIMVLETESSSDLPEGMITKIFDPETGDEIISLKELVEEEIEIEYAIYINSSKDNKE